MTDTISPARKRHLQRLTNEQFIVELMNFSQYGPIIQPFVIEAIRKYCEIYVAEGSDEETDAVISPRLWMNVAKDVLAQIEAKYDGNR
jgi:hypothetical protein